MPGKHAKLAPSSSKRWLSCTASPAYITSLVEQGLVQEGGKDSVYAQEGTEAHDWAGKVLLGQCKLEKVPKNFRPHIAAYVAVCMECEEGAGRKSQRLVEQKVPLFYSPEDTGTVDYAFLKMDKKGNPVGLYIRDLKYGQGVPVAAEENTQLAIYAQSLIEEHESFWDDLPPHLPVSIGIHQPRYEGDENLKLWEISVGELRDFCRGIRYTATLIRRRMGEEMPEPEEGSEEYYDLTELEFVPSYDNCQFCPAKAICKARAEDAFGDMMSLDDLDSIDETISTPMETLPVHTLVALYAKKKQIVSFLEGTEEYLTQLAHAGKAAPGTKLVKGRDGNRAWRDEEAAATVLETYLGDDAWERKLLGPAKVEKALKPIVSKPAVEKLMMDHTQRSEGRPVLALESDSRPEIAGGVDEFDVITDEED